MSLETIYTAFSAADAQLVRSRLEAAGIPAEVSDEIASLSMEGYSLAAGGIRIKVSEDDVDRARTLVAALSESETSDDST